MIKKIETDKELKYMKKFFINIKETMIDSCIDGYMGNAWTDNNFECGQIIVGDCCFFGGDSSSINAEELVKNIPEDF